MNNPIAFLDPLGLQHQPGGPWHPELPPGEKLSCGLFDSCEVLQSKISMLSDTIRAHRNWDKKRGVTRHAQEIEDFINAIEKCQRYYNFKCKPITKCDECVKVVVVVVGSILWMCLTRLPAPVW